MLLACACLLSAGCGGEDSASERGDGGGRVSKSSYEASYAVMAEEMRGRMAEVSRFSEEASTPEECEEAIHRSAEALREFAARLDGVEAPSDVATEQGALADSMRAYAARADAAAARFDTATPEELERINRDPSRLIKQVQVSPGMVRTWEAFADAVAAGGYELGLGELKVGPAAS